MDFDNVKRSKSLVEFKENSQFGLSFVSAFEVIQTLLIEKSYMCKVNKKREH